MNKELKLKMQAEGLAWCAYHKEFEPISNFYKNRTRKTGLQGYCIPIWKKLNKKRNRINNKGFGKWLGEFNTGLYRIINRFTNEIVYIGESDSIARRNYSHMSGCSTNCWQFMRRPLTKEEQAIYKFEAWIQETNPIRRKILERIYIKKYQPIFNTRYK